MEDISTIHKIFESVNCGQKATQSFSIENVSNETQKLVVLPCEEENSYACSERLKIQPLQAVVPPGKTARFTLTYVSYVENIIENFSYNIFDQGNLKARLRVHAQSVGPSLSFTSCHLKFFRLSNLSQSVKHIGLENTSKCEAKFYLDVGEDDRILQFSQTSGVIPVGTKLKINVTFKPTEPGVYHKQIFCLLQFQKPIIINVTGICKPKLRIEPKNLILKYPLQLSFSNTYEAYMTKMNMVKLLKEKKVQLLEKSEPEAEKLVHEIRNADEPGGENKNIGFFFKNIAKSSSQLPVDRVCNEIALTTLYVDIKNLPELHKATTLINLSTDQFYNYQWDCDPKNHFQIEPSGGVVEPSKKVNFSIYFTPSLLDRLYYIELDLKIFPCKDENDENEVNISQNIDLPITISLRIIGHSFPGSCGWIPQCTVVPKSLQLPSCVPGEVVYGTFAIERGGHLPVSFNITLSKAENFLIQPPLGYIYGNFHLFLVQFNGNSKEGVYSKDLKIFYNNANSTYDTIKLITSVEIPNIVFGNDNSYTFEPTFPGCLMKGKLPMKNTTNLYLNYELQVPDDINWIEIPHCKGLMEPKISCTIDVIFKPKTPCEYLDYVTCIVSSVSAPEYLKTVTIRFIGSCQFGYLVATPSVHDFGECTYMTEKSIKVHLFNFSPVLLYYKLYTMNQNLGISNIEKDVKLVPSQGSIPGKTRMELEVSVTPHTIDALQNVIMYQIMENDSEDSSPCEDPKTLFSFKFEGVLPTFQIIDINIDGGGPLFSPDWIWKMMEINRLNRGLKSLESEKINLRFPEAVLNTCPINIALLLESNQYGEVSFTLDKKVICSCVLSSCYLLQPPVCSHVDAMNITPMEGLLGPKKRLILQIVLNYNKIENCELEWTLNLPYDRKIVFCTSVVTLPDVELSMTSMYMPPIIHLKPVFIGDTQPPLQLFWLYNNTCQVASYVIDNAALKDAGGYGLKIVECINPIGNLPPFSCLPLAFSFNPKEIIPYSLETIISTQNRRLEVISLKGEGVPYAQQFSELTFEHTIPEKPILYNSNIALECSVNVINVNFLSTFSQTKRLFFLHNKSSSEEWAFRWHSFKIDQLINAHIEPAKGLVQPLEKIDLTLVLQSCCHPTSISFSIPCDVINNSELRIYEDALLHREILKEKTEDYFTITEKGISQERPDFEIPKKPNPYHLFLTINANIIGHRNIDLKLSVNQQLVLKTSSEIPYEDVGVYSTVSSHMRHVFQTALENMIWHVLHSEIFKRKIKVIHDSWNHNYTHLMPYPKQGREPIYSQLFFMPDKNYVQSFLEDALKNILLQNFTTNGFETNLNPQVSDQ